MRSLILATLVALCATLTHAAPTGTFRQLPTAAGNLSISSGNWP